MRLTDLILRIDGWLRSTRDIQRLSALDNRLLADMGIDRKEIASMVTGRHRR